MNSGLICFLAFPVLIATIETAFATAIGTLGSNALGIIYPGHKSSYLITSAIANAAANFISNETVLAYESKIPRKIPGKANELFV